MAADLETLCAVAALLPGNVTVEADGPVAHLVYPGGKAGPASFDALTRAVVDLLESLAQQARDRLAQTRRDDFGSPVAYEIDRAFCEHAEQCLAKARAVAAGGAP